MKTKASFQVIEKSDMEAFFVHIKPVCASNTTSFCSIKRFIGPIENYKYCSNVSQLGAVVSFLSLSIIVLNAAMFRVQYETLHFRALGLAPQLDHTFRQKINEPGDLNQGNPAIL
jgi:hypothetical protein